MKIRIFKVDFRNHISYLTRLRMILFMYNMSYSTYIIKQYLFTCLFLFKRDLIFNFFPLYNVYQMLCLFIYFSLRYPHFDY